MFQRIYNERNYVYETKFYTENFSGYFTNAMVSYPRPNARKHNQYGVTFIDA